MDHLLDPVLDLQERNAAAREGGREGPGSAGREGMDAPRVSGSGTHVGT